MSESHLACLLRENRLFDLLALLLYNQMRLILIHLRQTVENLLVSRINNLSQAVRLQHVWVALNDDSRRRLQNQLNEKSRKSG